MSGAAKSGLFVGSLNFLANIGLGVVFPLCAPVCALAWGAGAGALAVLWERDPYRAGRGRHSGAKAGAIAGAGGLLGLLVGILALYSLFGGQEDGRPDYGRSGSPPGRAHAGRRCGRGRPISGADSGGGRRRRAAYGGHGQRRRGRGALIGAAVGALGSAISKPLPLLVA